MSLMSMMKSRSLERRPSAISVIPPAHVYKAYSDVDTSSYTLAPGCQVAIRMTTLLCPATTSEQLHPSPEHTDLPTPLNISQPNCRRSSVPSIIVCGSSLEIWSLPSTISSLRRRYAAPVISSAGLTVRYYSTRKLGHIVILGTQSLDMQSSLHSGRSLGDSV